MHIHININIHKHTHTHTHSYSYTYTYINIYTHTHTFLVLALGPKMFKAAPDYNLCNYSQSRERDTHGGGLILTRLWLPASVREKEVKDNERG